MASVHGLASRTAQRLVICAACGVLALLAWVGTVFSQSTPAVKAYPCPAGTAATVANRLQNEFGATSDVRITTDERTSQVIVCAPPEVQANVGRRLGEIIGPQTGPARPSERGEPAAAGQLRMVPLHHRSAEQFEASLANILGDRLAATAAERPQTRRYRVAFGSNGSVDLTIDLVGSQVLIDGPPDAVQSCSRLVQALDRPEQQGDRDTRLLPLRTTKPAGVRATIAAIRDATGQDEPRMPLAARLFQAKNGGGGQPTPDKAAGDADRLRKGRTNVGLVNPVEIESIEGLDVLVLRGKAQDVEQVMKIIEHLERVSAETEPAVQVLMLQYGDCRSLAKMLQSLYDEVYEPRQGKVSITAAVKPNALLILGRPENVRTVVDLAGRLDKPVPPDTQFRVFQLRHATASSVQATIDDFYKTRDGSRDGLGPKVRATADVRSNAVLIQAGPRDMDEVAALIARLDTSSSAAVNEMRVIQLEHALATDVEDILRSAIGAGMEGSSGGDASKSDSQKPAANRSSSRNTQRSAMLRFLTIDTRGRRLIESGILSDIRVTADRRANAVVVSAPSESIGLIEALIRQLDQLPPAEAQLKVFTIVNGDATSLSKMLEGLFGVHGASSQSGGGPAAAPTGAEGSLVPPRFAVDARTNSIIASGTASELGVVEAILMRLDDSEARHRKTEVFRLKNSYADKVAESINNFLRSERQVQMQMQQTPGMISAFEQIEREVVVVPEMVSNSLILSATPRFFDEVKSIVEQLDARPPMVMIQVLIAQVNLDNVDEFGLEWGLQDGLLFDRSLLSNPLWQTKTTTDLTTSTQTQTLIAANNAPGFNFNTTDPLGNSGAANALANATQVGGQGLSNFGVGRTSSRTGFGGLVLSASSESVSVLLRALNQCHRLEVLQRPQIMTMDNQEAEIQVGQKVPRITTATFNGYGQQINNTVLEDTGVILHVLPKISPDGLVVMEIIASKSDVGPESEGTPVTVAGGVVIRSPRINITQAQTTVSATSNQTVVLGGLISKSKDELHRKVPLLGDIPLLGRLFRFDSVQCMKTELLIIMTPHIVRSEAEADAIKQAEAARMSWCLGDVIQMHGDLGLRKRTDAWSDAETHTVYPDMKIAPMPEADKHLPELVPTPAAAPAEKAK
jgi:general secretion pathway protein D